MAMNQDYRTVFVTHGVWFEDKFLAYAYNFYMRCAGLQDVVCSQGWRSAHRLHQQFNIMPLSVEASFYVSMFYDWISNANLDWRFYLDTNPVFSSVAEHH